VASLLQYMGYSLQAKAKVTEGNQHPDRNAQFECATRWPASTWVPSSGDET
jgi:hypothetical protein